MGFCFSSKFRPHFSRLERVLQNLLLNFKVFVVHKVASLGVSVLPLHTSLSAYNWDKQFTYPPQLNEADSCIPNYDTESRRFQERESIMPQRTRLFPTDNIKKAEHKTVRFHPTTKVRGLSRSHARNSNIESNSNKKKGGLSAYAHYLFILRLLFARDY